MSKRMHVIQHVPFEGPAAILDWAIERQCSVTYTRQWLGESLPSLSDFDFLVVMGGPMGVHDTQEFAWMTGEISFVGQSLQANKAVFGVCLGAQVMSTALGGLVTKNIHKEVGYFPVHRIENSSPWKELFPQSFSPLHWHGETFSLPAQSLLLGSSEGCVHQAFAWGERAVGVQYHMETTISSLEALILNAAEDLLPSGIYIQSEAQIRAGYHTAPNQLHQQLFALLDHLVR